MNSRLKRRGGLMSGDPLKTPGVGVSRRSSIAWQRSSRKHVTPVSCYTSSVRSMHAASSVSGPGRTRASPTFSMRVVTSQEPEWWCELLTNFIFVISLLSINCHSTYVLSWRLCMYCQCKCYYHNNVIAFFYSTKVMRKVWWPKHFLGQCFDY